MQGTATLSAFTTQLTFSNTKSRIIGITPKFRKEFPEYVVGSSFNGLAEHTWGVVETYAHGGTMISLAVNGVGQIAGYDKFQKVNDNFNGIGSIVRLAVNDRVRMSVPALYHGFYHPYANAYLNVHQRLSSHVDGIVQLNNLLNAFRNDIDAFSANIGRQTSLGLQIRL
jgi:hypothetical protein